MLFFTPHLGTVANLWFECPTFLTPRHTLHHQLPITSHITSATTNHITYYIINYQSHHILHHQLSITLHITSHIPPKLNSRLSSCDEPLSGYDHAKLILANRKMVVNGSSDQFFTMDNETGYLHTFATDATNKVLGLPLPITHYIIHSRRRCI